MAVSPLLGNTQTVFLKLCANDIHMHHGRYRQYIRPQRQKAGGKEALAAIGKKEKSFKQETVIKK